jgi:hypothetical protein
MAQSIGLFLIALMDHWVAAVSVRWTSGITFHNPRTRYPMGLGVIFFLVSAIAVDATLQNYWEANFKLSDEKLVDAEHARIVVRRSLL